VKENLLKTYQTKDKFIDPLAVLKEAQTREMKDSLAMDGIDPRLAAAIMASYGGSAQPQTPEPGSYTYGQDISLDDRFASLEKAFGEPVARFAGGGLAALSPLAFASGGKAPHKGSHYVQGAGGGQDDLIDARLADGEYVFDADIVAALGDGSNKQGAEKLDKMREAIRSHKRSAPNDKIPPKAKSPLSYLKGVK
jgi:hypothetical protein